MESIGPFVIDCLYEAGSTALWLYRENGDVEAERILHVTKGTLERLSQRWSVAAAYVEILTKAAS